MTVVAPDYKNPDNTKEYEATVVGSDTYSDLAVLKISRDDPFEYATLGDSDTVRVGQDVCVLGNPKQLLNSLTRVSYPVLAEPPLQTAHTAQAQ
ncbi:serine protease, partial [human gut metagenome]